MGRKRTGMKRRNFPGRKAQRRQEALRRAIAFNEALGPEAEGRVKRMDHIKRLWMLVVA